jgi:acetyltransferase-like isoleucine patch superfamily enzyme
VLKKLKRLRQVARNIIHPMPINMRRCGYNSAIYRPRRVVGPENIELGDRTIVLRHSWLAAISEYAGERYQPNLIIGNDVYIGQYACIVATQKMTIGDGSVLSEYVYITDNSHGLHPDAGLIMAQKLFSKGEVAIGPNCFVGYRACILPGVQLGERCIVGANSVVTKSFPAFSMVAGVPARLIKRYSNLTKQWVSVEDVVAERSFQR